MIFRFYGNNYLNADYLNGCVPLYYIMLYRVRGFVHHFRFWLLFGGAWCGGTSCWGQKMNEDNIAALDRIGHDGSCWLLVGDSSCTYDVRRGQFVRLPACVVSEEEGTSCRKWRRRVFKAANEGHTHSYLVTGSRSWMDKCQTTTTIVGMGGNPIYPYP
jgi:hypothetical protein